MPASVGHKVELAAIGCFHHQRAHFACQPGKRSALVKVTREPRYLCDKHIPHPPGADGGNQGVVTLAFFIAELRSRDAVVGKNEARIDRPAFLREKLALFFKLMLNASTVLIPL